MVMVGIDSGSLQTDSKPKSSGLVLGQQLLGTILHSSNEPGELSQWLCHDDSTINIGICIIIIIIIINKKMTQAECKMKRTHSRAHLMISGIWALYQRFMSNSARKQRLPAIPLGQTASHANMLSPRSAAESKIDKKHDITCDACTTSEMWCWSGQRGI